MLALALCALLLPLQLLLPGAHSQPLTVCDADAQVYTHCESLSNAHPLAVPHAIVPALGVPRLCVSAKCCISVLASWQQHQVLVH